MDEDFLDRDLLSRMMRLNVGNGKFRTVFDLAKVELED